MQQDVKTRLSQSRKRRQWKWTTREKRTPFWEGDSESKGGVSPINQLLEVVHPLTDSLERNESEKQQRASSTTPPNQTTHSAADEEQASLSMQIKIDTAAAEKTDKINAWVHCLPSCSHYRTDAGACNTCMVWTVLMMRVQQAGVHLLRLLLLATKAFWSKFLRHCHRSARGSHVSTMLRNTAKPSKFNYSLDLDSNVDDDCFYYYE